MTTLVHKLLSLAQGEAMRQAVFEYIETDCNPLRLHSANSFLSPVEFEVSFKQSLAS